MLLQERRSGLRRVHFHEHSATEGGNTAIPDLLSNAHRICRVLKNRAVEFGLFSMLYSMHTTCAVTMGIN